MSHGLFYIYAFSRRFYPKQLTLHSSYSFTFYQLLLSLGIKPMILALLAPCSTIWATWKLYRCPYYVSGSGNRMLCSVTLLSMQGQKTLGFHQKYLNLCSEDEWKSCGFGTKWEWVIQWRNFHLWVKIPLRPLNGLELEQKVLISSMNIFLSILVCFPIQNI